MTATQTLVNSLARFTLQLGASSVSIRLLAIMCLWLGGQPMLSLSMGAVSAQDRSAAIARITTGKIHLIMVADTEDFSIGESTTVDLRHVTELFASQVPKHQLQVTKLTGHDVRRRNILDTVGALRINPNLDTVVFYFCGHGGYDQNAKDHFLYGLGRRDACFRSEVRAAIQRFRPQLTVIIADTCSVFQRSPVYAPTGVPTEAATPLFRSLFLEPVGIVDISSTRPDEGAHGDSNGGWFTASFCMYSMLNRDARRSWDEVLNGVSERLKTEHPNAAQTAYAISPLPPLPREEVALPVPDKAVSDQSFSDLASQAFDTSDHYAAVAYSQLTGRYGSAFGYKTREEAEQSALKYVNTADAQVIYWCKNAWIAFAGGKLGGSWGVAWADTEEEATKNALEAGNRNALFGSRIRFCIHANQNALAPARLRIEVPSENTVLLLNGQPTRQTGLLRTFTTPNIESGKQRRYTITILRPSSNTQDQTQDRAVEAKVAAGLVTHVTFPGVGEPRIRTIHPQEDPFSDPQQDTPLTLTAGQAINRTRFGAYVTDSQSGVQVTGVMPNSPATRCQNGDGKNWYLEADDVITHVNGRAVQTEAEYRAAVLASPALLRITVIGGKDNQRYEFTAQLDDTATTQPVINAGQPANRTRFGAYIQNSRSGVQVTGNMPNSPAMRLQHGDGKNWWLEAGDIITHVNGQPVQTEAEYRAAVLESPSTMKISVIGGKDRQRYEFSAQLND